MKPTPSERFASIALVSAVSLSIVACTKSAKTTANTSAANGPMAKTTVGTEIDDTVVTASVKAALPNDASIQSPDSALVTRIARFSSAVL